MISIEELLDCLNDEQRAAVLYNEGNSLILAGAGSGKTRVLTTKIAYLLTQGYVPSQILALTFTNKAAGEMRERIGSMIGDDFARYLWMGTFHSIFARLLRRYAPLLGYSDNYTIYDSADSKALIKMILKEMALDEKFYEPKRIISLISNVKNEGVMPDRVAQDQQAMNYFTIKKISRFPEVYSAYVSRCHRANAMDFDDLLLNMYRLLSQHEIVRNEMHERFKYILVDEYQDTNRVQDKIVKLLKGEGTRVCVVGDDAQSIYSFRGAVIDNILNFKRNFPDAVLLKLTKNYRSTGTIVNLAGKLIEKNSKRIPKVVEAVAEEGNRVGLISSFTAQVEAQTIAAKIFALIKNKGVSPEDIAVLYRTNAQSRLIEDNLRMFGVPYRIYGGLSFFDRKEVKDVLAYLRLVVNPNDDEAFRRVHNTPTRGIGATTFAAVSALALKYDKSCMQVASDPLLLQESLKSAAIKHLSAFVSLIETMRSRKDELSADAYLKYVIHTSGIPTMYSDGSVEAEGKLENIDELLNALSEYMRSKSDEGDDTPTIEDFVREMALFTDRDAVEDDDSPKVTLMTMHASKGLEFPHVYIVGLEEGLIPSGRSDSEASIEEERRLLYVAITRAKEACTLSFARERMIHGQTNISSPSRFIFDLDPLYVEDYTGILRSKQRSTRLPSGDRKPSSPSSTSDPAPKRMTRIIRKSSATKAEDELDTIMSEVDGMDFKKGDHVYHDRFGRGLVEGFSNSFSGIKVHVDFEEEGKKVLIAKFARLRPE
ncbi:ATP-dependent helicase [Porphyromonas sp.]|uniref:ATP-dependent helicase n=1 Tax=Porphyromonas sp. TaxID=1924944 RepID=UPI0026DA840E|nr:UvrD-helicase domain-containing protein [Porphyromonas sp.]MDO4770630.1 UvrD-helicase domain-containing protein [Porphyromonas sp.]